MTLVLIVNSRYPGAVRMSSKSSMNARAALLLLVSLCSCSGAPKSSEVFPPPAHLIGADGAPVAGAAEPEVVQLKSVETAEGMLHVTVGNVAGDYVLVCNLQANNETVQSCAAPSPERDYLLFRKNTKWLMTGAKQPIDLQFMTDWGVSYNDKENIGLLPAKKSDEPFRIFWLSSWTAKTISR